MGIYTDGFKYKGEIFRYQAFLVDYYDRREQKFLATYPSVDGIENYHNLMAYEVAMI